jgi:ribose 5-phosphate isomerase B
MDKKKIFFATDHAGFEMKNELINFVKSELSFDVEDFGAHEYNSADDYPDFIHKAGEAVSSSDSGIAIILGGSGQGEAIVANRYPRVRAAVLACENLELVKISREHNDANILSIGARFVSLDFAKDAVRVFLQTKFSEDERHRRRIEKIDKKYQ